MTKQEKDRSEEPEARRLRRELFDEEMLDKLIDAIDERGLPLTGEGGFLPEMIKAVLERGMDAEQTDHLGYEKGRPGQHPRQQHDRLTDVEASRGWRVSHLSRTSQR